MKRSKVLSLRSLIEKAVVSLDDTDALDAVELFEHWAADTAYEAAVRVSYENKLYKCVQAHTSQEGWEPPDTPALWTEVAKPGQGDTPDNPIPYNNNMELVKDKYYSQDGVVYICIRDTGIPVYNNLADLVGLYVDVWVG